MIYEKYADWVFRTLQRQKKVRASDLEDQMQEVFRAVHKSLPKFDRTKPLEPWLYSICAHVASRYGCSAYIRRVFTVDISAFWERPSEALTPERNLAIHDEQKDVDELLDKLDLDKRVVFVMFEFDEISCEEIAKTLGIPVGTVHSRLSAARKILIKAYNRREAERSRKGDP